MAIAGAQDYGLQRGVPSFSVPPLVYTVSRLVHLLVGKIMKMTSENDPPLGGGRGEIPARAPDPRRYYQKRKGLFYPFTDFRRFFCHLDNYIQ